ncbi:MAG TPA: PLP-dependent aminotransferase family protein, partial [Ruminococcaceae bacterium]|nr:PLP-dependent aminotransferase family protein [Oscillospiraceae bacterium]
GLEKHLRHLRKLYSEKSEKLCAAVGHEFGGTAEILLQETPLTVLLTVHSVKGAEELCSIAAEKGVRVTAAPGGLKIRLGFAGIPMDDIEPAVACLKEAWGKYLLK